MRHFEFELQLPDGRSTTATATSATWREAFSTACMTVEASEGILPGSGIVCRSYRARPARGSNHLDLLAA